LSNIRGFGNGIHTEVSGVDMSIMSQQEK